MRGRKFTQADEDRVKKDYARYAEMGRMQELASEMGRSPQHLCKKAAEMGITAPVKMVNGKRAARFSDIETAMLFEEYEAAAVQGKLPDLARKMSRTVASITCKAGKLGLRTFDSKGRPMAWSTGDPMAKNRPWTPERRALLREKLIAYYSTVPSHVMEDRCLRGMKTKVHRYGSVAGTSGGSKWKSGWREIGGYRKYYRSRWEANYARYLNWLQQRGEILDWKHEPETFWFDKIKRGTRSYLPDFRVWELDGTSKLHEVKGWMDTRSKTTLNRMRIYYPKEEIVLIEKKQYDDIKRKLGHIIEGWE